MCDMEVEAGRAQRQRYRVMPHQFFENLKRHPRIEQVRRKGMPVIPCAE